MHPRNCTVCGAVGRVERDQPEDPLDVALLDCSCSACGWRYTSDAARWRLEYAEVLVATQEDLRATRDRVRQVLAELDRRAALLAPAGVRTAQAA